MIYRRSSATSIFGDRIINPLFKQGTSPGLRLAILVVLSVVLMVCDHQGRYTQSIRQAVSVIVSPLYYLTDTPSRFITWIETNLTSHHHLVKVNQRLTNKILVLQSQLQRQLAVEKENVQLRALLNSSSNARGQVHIARLLAVNSDPFVSEVILDKGKKAGLYIGQPVIDAYGVMGQVIRVNRITSRVLLLNDPRSAIPVQVSRNGIRAIAVGNGANNTLTLKHIPKTAGIELGDQLVTSGLGQRFPAGYPVGVVTDVIRNTGDTFATIIAKPSAHLNRSDTVLLVFPGKHIASFIMHEPEFNLTGTV